MATKNTTTPGESSPWATSLMPRPVTPPTTLPDLPAEPGDSTPATTPRTPRKAPVTGSEPIPAPTPTSPPPQARTPRTALQDTTPGPLLPVKVRPPLKRAVGFNLPEDVVELIDLAVAEQAAQGVRIREGEVVTAAIRQVYGRLARRQPASETP